MRLLSKGVLEGRLSGCGYSLGLVTRAQECFTLLYIGRRLRLMLFINLQSKCFTDKRLSKKWIFRDGCYECREVLQLFI